MNIADRFSIVKNAAEPITDTLSTFFAPFGVKVEFGTDFSYYPDEELITYALLISDEDGLAFKNFAEKIFPEICSPVFIWSLFHELGHHMTVDDFEEEDWKNYNSLVASHLDRDSYFHLPIELMATCWAGAYMKTHADKVTNLVADLNIAIDTFNANLKNA